MRGTARHWLGLAVPKRLARRAVTRTLVKRQMRAACDSRLSGLAPGQWLLRLRAPFDARAFPQAATRGLQQAVRSELDTLFAGLAPA